MFNSCRLGKVASFSPSAFIVVTEDGFLQHMELSTQNNSRPVLQEEVPLQVLKFMSVSRGRDSSAIFTESPVITGDPYIPSTRRRSADSKSESGITTALFILT